MADPPSILAGLLDGFGALRETLRNRRLGRQGGITIINVENVVVKVQGANKKSKVINIGSKGQIGVVGENARIGTLTQKQSLAAVRGVDLGALAPELATLRKALKDRSRNIEHDEAIGHVATAEKAAKKGDRAGVVAALKAAGKWVLNVAKDIGVPVAVEVLKRVSGIPLAP